MARRPSRNALASGNFDKIIESRGGIDRKVSQKLKATKELAVQPVVMPPAGAERRASSNLLRGKTPSAENLAKIQLHKDTHITDKQAKFIENKVELGMSDRQAALQAGYSDKAMASQLARNDKVQGAIAERREAYQEVVQMSRKRVMDGLLEAVDMAKVKADPLSMVAGWREIAKICGYYEPTRVQVDVSVNGKMLLHQMSSMSQEDLLKLADMGDALEGEFTEIEDAQ